MASDDWNTRYCTTNVPITSCHQEPCHFLCCTLDLVHFITSNNETTRACMLNSVKTCVNIEASLQLSFQLTTSPYFLIWKHVGTKDKYSEASFDWMYHGIHISTSPSLHHTISHEHCLCSPLLEFRVLRYAGNSLCFTYSFIMHLFTLSTKQQSNCMNAPLHNTRHAV